MGNIDIMHFFPFLQHNQLSMCSCRTHLKLLLSSFHSEGIRGLKRITRIFILQLVQKANNLRTILKCQQSMIMNKIYNWFLMMMIKRIYSAGSCSDSRQRKRQVVTRRRLTHCCWPNLTKPLYNKRNEEYGQKRKWPPGPSFWGTVIC